MDLIMYLKKNLFVLIAFSLALIGNSSFSPNLKAQTLSPEAKSKISAELNAYVKDIAKRTLDANKNSGKFKIYQLWKQLPKKMMQ